MFGKSKPLVPPGTTKVVLSDKGYKELPTELRTAAQGCGRCDEAFCRLIRRSELLRRGERAVAADHIVMLNLSQNKLTSTSGRAKRHLGRSVRCG